MEVLVAILNKQKHNFFLFTKSENRRAEQVLPGTSGRGEKVEKGCGRANILQILCTQVDSIIASVEDIPGTGGHAGRK
jgi:hypothetical protein